MVTKITDPNQKAQIAQDILAQLPDWFGIPESAAEYVRGCREKPVWADLTENGLQGFIALKETSPATAEIYVMGVVPARHRQGTGRALFEAFLDYAKTQGYSFIQVKTVRKGAWESYDKTNEFYVAMGFQELECFPQFWDEKNPCQIYIRTVSQE